MSGVARDCLSFRWTAAADGTRVREEARAFLSATGLLADAARDRDLEPIVRRVLGARRAIDPRSHGARGDGQSDDSAAFRRADADAESSGGFLAIAPGTYLLDGVRQSVPWLGSGCAATMLRHRGGARQGAYMLLGASDLVLAGLALHGNRDAQPQRTRLYSFDGQGRSLYVRAVRVTNTVAAGVCAFDLTRTAEVRASSFDDIGPAIGSGSRDLQGNAVLSTGGTTGRLVCAGNDFINPAPASAVHAPCAVQVSGASPSSTLTVVIEDNTAEQFGCAAHILGVFDVYEFTRGSRIAGNRIRRPFYSGVKIANSSDVRIERNEVYDVIAPFPGALIAWSGNLRDRGAVWDGVTMTSNVVHDATAHGGYAIDAASNALPAHAGGVRLVDNRVERVHGGVRLYGLRDVNAIDNIVRGCTSSDERFAGVYVARCEGDIAWSGGEVADCASVGVRADEALDGTRLRLQSTTFRDNRRAHVKVGDSTGRTTCALLSVSSCGFSGGAQPVVADGVAQLDLADNVSDSRALTLRAVAAVRSHGNSWDQ